GPELLELVEKVRRLTREDGEAAAELLRGTELVRRVLLRPGVRPLPGAERALDYAGTPFPQHYTVRSGRDAVPVP
ncbi:hypothetical protein, partial [Streptomyces eurythermus]